MSEKKYLVVGGSGFVGSHIVNLLLSLNQSVRVFGRSKENLISNVDKHELVDWVAGNIQMPSELIGSLNDITDIIYLAHSTNPTTSMDNISFDLESNVVPFVKFLEAVSNCSSVKRFLYISSGGTVYGNPSRAVKFEETDPTEPISSYGLTKLVSEHYLKLCLSKHSNISTYILRVANAYGERQNLISQGAVGVFLNSHLEGKKIVIYGDGNITRDYVYVGDIAQATLACLENAVDTKGEVSIFNVGSGQGISLNQLIQLIENVTNSKLQVEYKDARSFDCDYNVLDISKITKLINWTPETTFKDGLLKTLFWIKESNEH